MGLTENIIKSLDKDEQRYINNEVLAQRDSQAKTLFELIDQYGEDEEKIASRFKRSAPKGKLPVVRNQLQHILLKGIEQMHVEEYAFAEVNSMLLQIHIFIDKSAFDVVKRLLEKALKLAADNELFTQWIELLEIKLHLYQAKSYPEDTDAEDILEDYNMVCAKYSNHAAYLRLGYDQMLLTNDNYLLRTEEAKTKWENLYQHDLLSDISKALSKKAETKYWVIKAQYYLIHYRYEEAKTCFYAIIEVISANQFLRRSHAMNFFWAYSQLAHTGYFNRDTEIMRLALQSIRDAEKFNDSERLAAFTYYTNYGIAYYDLINDIPSLNLLLDEAYTGLRTWISRIKPDAGRALIVSCVSVWVELGEYDKALRIIREFGDYIHVENRLDGKIVLLFYELIAQIETGNELMVNDTLQNFNRYLLRHQFKREFEQIMVRFLKIVSSSSIHMKEELMGIKEHLLQLPDRSILDQHPVLYQILIDMIDSRLAGQKYHDYMKSSRAQT